MLRELENNVFILGDLEISIEEIPLLCRFMTSKEALSKVQTLVVSRKFVNGAMSAGRKATVIQTNKQSSLLMNKCKLQFAVVDFIAHCTSLQSITFDTVTLRPELFAKLGHAIVARSSANPRQAKHGGNSNNAELLHLALRSVPVGAAGLRALCPHIGKLGIQRLEMDKCGLGDDAGACLRA